MSTLEAHRNGNGNTEKMYQDPIDESETDVGIKIDANGNSLRNGKKSLTSTSLSSGEDDTISSTSDSKEEEEEDYDDGDEALTLKTR